MKIYKLLTCFVMAICCTFLCFGCGAITTNVTLGVYAPAGEGTFTPLTGEEDYSLTTDGYNLTLEGSIPYLTLTIDDVPEAGNIVAIRFKPSSTVTPDATTSFETREGEGVWAEHGEEFLEADGSIIWIVSVTQDVDYQIKIKWNTNFAEVTYTLTVDADATLEPAV
ncbi:MAG: hypothetical protein PHR96_04340 [Clostridia bacterium]|nr:hypothetical protein [Clostridia bacterium]